MSELQNSPVGGELKEKVYEGKAQKSVAENLATLAKYQGYSFIESIVDGTQNLNPERKARKSVFLTEDDKKAEREQLKRKLDIWVNLLANTTTVDEMASFSEAKAAECEQLLKANLKKVVDSSSELETNYRSVALFYKNTEMDKVNNISIMNASLDQITDLDDDRFIRHVTDEINSKFNRLDLRENYSLLCLPGYLKSNKVVSRWSKVAYDNKVMLVTDFDNASAVDACLDDFKDANLTSADIAKSNVVMTGNWVVGRGKHNDLGEDSDLYVPPSTALAGRMYSTKMSQVAAGDKFGTLKEIDGVRFAMKKTEIGEYDRAGLVPMVGEYGKAMAFSAKTLFNGDNLGLQTYSVVRVFDYINKVLADFLNRRAFENWTSLTEKDLRSQIVKFLDSITGPESLIEKFRIDRFERDEDQKDRIHLDIHIMPYFPAKSFVLKLDGTKGNFDTSTTQV